MKNEDSALERIVAEVIAPVRGRRLLATVSGGADSVALLVALKRIGADVVAAHCNFHLRGAESDRDMVFVQSLCKKLGVELQLIHFDVDAYRREHGGSMEMACRELRYNWFDSLSRQLQCVRILTAHHADDNIETMLLNMMRSCGLEGVKGMVADTGTLMRPLLTLHRCDIEQYLRGLGQDWIVDSTNLQNEPDRNFLRLEVLPLLNARFPGVSQRLARTQRNLGESYRVYSQWRQQKASGNVLSTSMMADSASASSLLHEWLRSYGFSAAQEAEMLRESSRETSQTRCWYAGDMAVTLRNGEFLRLPASMPHIDINEEKMPVTPQLLKAIKSTAGAREVYFPNPLEYYRWRLPHPGERMKISRNSSKKIADLLKEADIPLPYRNQCKVMCHPEHDTPLWIPDVRRAFGEFITADMQQCFLFSANKKHWPV